MADSGGRFSGLVCLYSVHAGRGFFLQLCGVFGFGSCCYRAAANDCHITVRRHGAGCVSHSVQSSFNHAVAGIPVFLVDMMIANLCSFTDSEQPLC